RSPFAHASLLAVDAAEALRQPGVVAIWTAFDLDLVPIPGDLRTAEVPTDMARPPLVQTVARYAGEPVAVVLATDRSTALDAAELVDLDLEPLPTVVDARVALTDDTLLFPEV